MLHSTWAAVQPLRVPLSSSCAMPTADARGLSSECIFRCPQFQLANWSEPTGAPSTHLATDNVCHWSALVRQKIRAGKTIKTERRKEKIKRKKKGLQHIIGVHKRVKDALHLTQMISVALYGPFMVPSNFDALDHVWTPPSTHRPKRPRHLLSPSCTIADNQLTAWSRNELEFAPLRRRHQRFQLGPRQMPQFLKCKIASHQHEG